MKIIPLFLIGFCVITAHINADLISLRADLWCPYNCEPESTKPGFMVEVAQAAFGKAQDGVDYELMDWKEAIQGVRSGKYNGLIGATKDPLSDLIYPNQELAEISQSFWIAKSLNWKFTGIKSLDGKILMVIDGYDYGEPIDEYIKQNKHDTTKIKVLDPGSSHRDAIVNIQSSPEKALFLDENLNMMNYLLSVGKQDLLKGTPSFLPPVKVYIAFSPENPNSKEYAKILDEGISNLKSTGIWQKLLDKYHLHSW